jgi:hypothetical protein
MCRNIRTLFNFEPPATDEEIQASALQYVRKVSGFPKPSKENEDAFDLAVEKVSEATRILIQSLITISPAKDRAVEQAKASKISARRFSKT